MDTMLIRMKYYGKPMNAMKSETDFQQWADELGCFQGCVDNAWIGMHVAHKRESGVMDQKLAGAADAQCLGRINKRLGGFEESRVLIYRGA
jgi:hypothetical protein